MSYTYAHGYEQIDRENQSLLRRLQYMKPSIDMVHFEQQWRENSQFARSQASREHLT